MNETIDLGDGITGEFTRWAPDRSCNPQYDGISDIEKLGLILTHKTPSGEPHDGIITFDSPEARRIFPNHAFWTVHAWEPMTLTPSVLCSCGWHGFITDGKWRSC